MMSASAPDTAGPDCWLQMELDYALVEVNHAGHAGHAGHQHHHRDYETHVNPEPRDDHFCPDQHQGVITTVY